MKKETAKKIKSVLNVIIITLLGALSIIFATLYIETFTQGFVYKYSLAIEITSIVLIMIITVLAIIFFRLDVEFLFKLSYTVIIFIAFILVGLYLFSITGLKEKITSVETLREYIKSFENYAIIIFIVLQFLQVVILPIPAFITVGAGTLLFGPLYGSIFSFIGIFAGSLVNFVIGRVFGYKVASWIAGKDNLDKALKSVKGKDKVVLTFMFLFPFFPDDILCFVSGLSTMSVTYYVIMIFITRAISIVVASYSYNGSIIPYNTWWGICLWILVFVVTILLTVFFYKKGEKIENWFKEKFSIKNKKGKNKKQHKN